MNRELFLGRLSCALAAAICGLGLGVPASAQTSAEGKVQSDQDIVVSGQTEAKSDWRRAETDHVVVFSKGGEGELRRVAKNLELLHGLLSRLYRRGDTSDDALKMQVTLVDSVSRLKAIAPADMGSQDGPFPAAFAPQYYYDARDDGEVLAIARVDQKIDLNTQRRLNADCDDYLSGGSVDPAEGGLALCGVRTPYNQPLVRPWEGMLYGAFARHFLLTYAPAAYPRWYLDGISALFSTIVVQRSGAMDYAGAPEGYRQIYRSYGYPDVGDMLTGRFPDTPRKGAVWTPYGAWLMTHYFVMAKPSPDRVKQFQLYMTAIRQGTPMATAAAAFGDMKKLQGEIFRHAGAAVAFAHAEPPQVPLAEPLMSRLSVDSGALVEARVEREARIAALRSGDKTGTSAGWLAELRRQGIARPGDDETLRLEAEVECRSGDAAQCLATANRMLAHAPDDIDGLTLKGVALTDAAVAGQADVRQARLTEARGTIGRAIALDGKAPAPLLAYFQSFTKAGEAVPDDAMLAMTKVIRAIPAAPGPRRYLGEELRRQGKEEIARRVLLPVQDMAPAGSGQAVQK